MELDHVVGEVDAPVEQVWDLLADLGGVERLVPDGGVPGIPAVERVSMQGEGQGAIRSVHLAGGATLLERFDVVDAATRTLIYVGLPPNPLPIDDYRATIVLTALGPSRTRVDWSSTGEPNGASLDDVRTVLETLHAALIDGLRRVSRI